MPVSKYYDIVFTVFNITLNLVVDVHIVVGGSTGPVHASPDRCTVFQCSGTLSRIRLFVHLS